MCKYMILYSFLNPLEVCESLLLPYGTKAQHCVCGSKKLKMEKL